MIDNSRMILYPVLKKKKHWEVKWCYDRGGDIPIHD